MNAGKWSPRGISKAFNRRVRREGTEFAEKTRKHISRRILCALCG
jgi:hypothetical protein